ncbi:glycosyltransferase family 39 protein [Protofrankia symbiont of Coriaria ruscifolia]|uniref:glycosyltransferase family 39 protein n=1 Tax=Protofrankia symbiont of Coriaria ruscifolia TaxID=1306542 RepID=UPI0010411D54|nr:glycosyltransferase family 39 protein [Protofrankia symbiont of Coriaria ruscifolia]
MTIVDYAEIKIAWPTAEIPRQPGPDAGARRRQPSADPPATGVPCPRARRPRPPRAVVLVTVLHFALLLTYSFTFTTWMGYDEAQHVDMVYGLQHGSGWPAPGERIISAGVAATSDDFDRGRYAQMFQSGGRNSGEPPFAEIDPTPRDQRLSFDALGGPGPVTDGRLSNQMVQHPPLIYVVGAALLSALPGSSHWAYDQQVWILRLLNIIVVAPLPLLAWEAARRFGLRAPLAQATAVMPLAVPGLTRVGATFNNDGLLMLSVGGLTVLLAGVLTGDMRRRTAVGVGLLLGLAFLTKALALPLVVVVAAAYLAGWARPRRSRRSCRHSPRRHYNRIVPTRVLRAPPVCPALLAIGIACATGGWWWARNYVLYDAVQPNGWATEPPRREPILLPKSFYTWYEYFWRTIISRFWGGLGMFEPPQLSPVAIAIATTAVLGCVIAAVVRPPITGGAQGHGFARLRASASGRPLVLLMPILLAYLLVGQRSYSDYLKYTQAIAIQGRYLYMGVVGLAVVTAVGLGRLLRVHERAASLIVLVGALVMQAAALWAVCAYYWLPRGESVPPLHVAEVVTVIGRWAPFPAGVTIATFVLCLVIACVTVAEMVREARLRPRGRPDAPGPLSGIHPAGMSQLRPYPADRSGRGSDRDAGVVAEHQPVRPRTGPRRDDLDIPADQ